MKKAIRIILVLMLLLTLCACGQEETQPTTPPCKHNYTEQITKETSCAAEGEKTFTCSLCGDSYTEAIAKTEHAYTDAVTKEPTCAAEGEMTFTCSACGDSYTEAIAKTEHTYTDAVTKEPTCAAEGEKTFTCSVCGDKQTEAIAKTEHNYSGKVTKQPTCTAEGEKTFTCKACGDKYTESVKKAAHEYTGKITTEPTCTAKGVKTYTCNACGDQYTESVKKIDHSYSGAVTKEPTCTAKGEKTFTCSGCGDKYTEAIDKTEHSYTTQTTRQPSCTTEGELVKTCSSCGDSSSESIPALGHDPDNNMMCRRCGEKCPIELSMTDAEKKQANAVQWISQRQIWHQDDEGRYVLVFSLLDDSQEKELAAPAVVEIHIKNDAGEIVYRATKILTTKNYQNWYYNNGSVKKYQGTIYIYDNEIAPGKVPNGDIYFTVYNKGYFSFDESKLSISELPEKPTEISLPTMPVIMMDYTYSGNLDSSVKITGITYKVNGDDLEIYFTGEKLYDRQGNGYSQSCKIGWKLYDSEGYVVASGTAYTENICVGERFRNEKDYAWDCIVPGESYRLEILNTK